MVDIVKEAIPAPALTKGRTPGKRIFKALRIAVNDELNAFQSALNQAAKLTPVNIHGRIAVTHIENSLEDRICKQKFKKWSTPKETPLLCRFCRTKFQAPFKLVTKKPMPPFGTGTGK